MSLDDLDTRIVEKIGELSYVPTPPVAHTGLRAVATLTFAKPFVDMESAFVIPVLALGSINLFLGWKADCVIYNYSQRNFRPESIPREFYHSYANRNLTQSQTRIGLALLASSLSFIAANPTLFYYTAAASMFSAVGKYAMRHLSDRHVILPPE